MSNDFEKKMAHCEAVCKPVQPPCHEEIIVPLFDIVKRGKTLSNGKFLMPADIIKASYPDITDKDLKQLLKYLDAAERYCEDVSSWFSRQYGTPFVPESEKAQQDALRVVEVCQKKYTWLQDEQVRYILESVCGQSNR